MHDLQNAQKEFEQYIRLRPNSSQGPMRLAFLKISQKKYDEAMKLFQSSIALDPTQTESYDGMAAIFRLKGNNEKAVALIRDQAEKTNSAKMYVLLGRVYLEQKQLDKAEVSLKKALELDPASYDTFFLLGTLYSQESNVDGALAQYQAAIKVNANNPGLWTIIGMLQEQTNRRDEAIRAYSRALEIEPNAGVAANNLAWMYATQGGDLDKALEMARRAKVALPNVPSVSDTLGWIYYQRKLYDSSVPLLQEAVKGNPNSAEFHFHLAASLIETGKKDQARAELSSALKLDSKMRDRVKVKEMMQQLNL
jgi:tetratricopeptide (TPR) repeat protein